MVSLNSGLLLLRAQVLSFFPPFFKDPSFSSSYKEKVEFIDIAKVFVFNTFTKSMFSLFSPPWRFPVTQTNSSFFPSLVKNT